MSRVLWFVMCASVFGCGESKKQTPPPSASPAVVATDASVAKLDQVTRAIAEFDGDQLNICAQATLTHASTLEVNGLTPQEAALLLVDEGLGAAGGGETLIGEASDRRKITAAWRKLIFEATAEDAKKGVDLMRAAITEGTKPEAMKKEGRVHTETCEFPNRTPLGLCTLSDAVEDFGFALAVLHFDVKSTTDSDSAMKNCMAVGGKWTAASGDAAAMERARQHALDLQKRVDRLQSLISP